MSASDFENKLAGFQNDVGEIINNNAEMPVWANSMLELFKGLISELSNVNKLYEKIDQLESKIAVNKTISDRLVDNNKKLQGEVKSLSDSVDLQEQRSRNYNLVVHGVPEALNEKPDQRVTKILNDELELNLDVRDLQNCHRLGRKDDTRKTRANQPRPRAIIVKFKNYNDRILVFKNKKKLKGRPFLITENLTEKRYKLYTDVSTELGRKNVWTAEGRIFAMINKSKKLITSIEDISEP